MRKKHDRGTKAAWSLAAGLGAGDAWDWFEERKVVNVGEMCYFYEAIMRALRQSYGTIFLVSPRFGFRRGLKLAIILPLFHKYTVSGQGLCVFGDDFFSSNFSLITERRTP